MRRETNHSTTQPNRAQHSTAQHSTAQHSTAQRSAAQHSTIEWLLGQARQDELLGTVPAIQTAAMSSIAVVAWLTIFHKMLQMNPSVLELVSMFNIYIAEQCVTSHS